MFRAFRFLSIVSLLITCVFQCSIAQLSQNYKPLAVSGGRDLKLIGALRDQLDDELKRIEKKERTPYVVTRYTHNTQSLVRLVKARRVVKNDTLQNVVDQTFDSLLHNTHLQSRPRRVLIVKLPYGNAMCMGEGTFLITTGLLGRITNEAQLAFTLAHEIAHYELNHVRNRVLKTAKMEYEKKARMTMVKIFRPTNVVGLNELDSLRKLVYAMSRFSRENEREADSVGLVLMRNAGYQPHESIGLLSVLDSIDYTKERLGYKLFVEFDFPKYPFQEYWLRDRPSVYSKLSADHFLFSRDSIQSHPEIVQRQNWLMAQLSSEDPVAQYEPNPVLLDSAIQLAEFADLETATEARRYDYAMLLALELKSSYVRNRYLTTTISKILVDLYDAKNENRMREYVPFYVSGHGDELRIMNTFLHNITKEETGEIAFNFLNNQSNFNPDDPEHYLLLWKICDVTKRDTVKARVKERFKTRFGKMKYYFQYFEKMT